MNSFIEKLKIKTKQLTSSDHDASLLRQSRAAASFDAVVTLALAFDEIFPMDMQQTNLLNVLNQTLSNIKYSGLAVSEFQKCHCKTNLLLYELRISITLHDLKI